MDNCRMNRNICRMPPGSSQNMRCNPCRQDSSCRMAPENGLFHHLDDNFPIAMGYVPYQKWTETFDLCKALQMGTIFPDLCKPFCGKGGAVCR